MRSLRQQLNLQLFGVLSAVLLCACALAFLAVRMVVTSQFDETLEAKAQALAALVEFEPDTADHTRGLLEFEIARGHMREFQATREPEYFQIWYAGDRVLAGSDSLGDAELPYPEVDWDSATSRDCRLPDGRSGRQVVLRFVAQIDTETLDEGGSGGSGGSAASTEHSEIIVEYQGDGPPQVTLVVARSKADVRGALAGLALGAILLYLVMLLAGAMAVSYAVRRGLAPLSRLATRMDSIDGTTLDLRLPVEHAASELHPILSRVNELLDRLESAFQREQRFASSAAHELKNPIGELRAMCEVALRWQDGDSLQQAVAGALDVSERMDRTVRMLLAMARASAGTGLEVNPDLVGIAEVVEEVWAPLAGMAEEQELEVSFDVPLDAALHTDPILFRMILTNLCENATLYSPHGGQLHIGWSSTGATGVFTVANTAVGLTATALERMFEPFWRQDQRHDDRGHTGLGLPLVRQLALRLGGRVEASLAGGASQLVMTVSLPGARGATAPAPQVTSVM